MNWISSVKSVCFFLKLWFDGRVKEKSDLFRDFLFQRIIKYHYGFLEGWKMNKVHARIFVIISCFCIANKAYALGGGGTEADPYRITSFADFQEFASNSPYWTTGVYTQLEVDLDLHPQLSGRQVYSTAVIAPDTSLTSGFQGVAFSGVFDGRNHTISWLHIRDYDNSKDYLGLFGGSNGVIKNLRLDNCSVRSGHWAIGGLVGFNIGTISDCSIATRQAYDIKGDAYVGGLVGYNSYGTIQRCFSKGGIYGNSNVGGLIGYNASSTVLDCYSTVSVCAENGYVGGLIGLNISSSVDNCYSSGFVEYYLHARPGGLVGGNTSGNITDSFWDIESSCIDISAGGQGKTTAEMKTKSFFTNAGWDFTNTWYILNNEYPKLHAFQPPEMDANLPIQSDYPTLPSELSNYENIVFITHGWNGPLNDTDHIWIDEMASKIQDYIVANTLSSSWKAYAYHWGQYSGGRLSAGHSKEEAEKIGIKLGEQIVTFTNCKHVHLIAHSAGSWMIHNISREIKRFRPDITIHITFLDAYTPWGIIGVNSLGYYSEWAEQYVDHRGEGGISFDEIDFSGSLQSTNATLKGAHNIDITGMDPDFAKSGPDAHGWPCEWYQSTIPINQPSSRNWGFASSLESGVIPSLEVMQQTFSRGEREDYHIFEYSLPRIDHVSEMVHNPTYWGTYVPNYSNSDDIYIEGTKFTIVSGESISSQQEMMITATESTSLAPSDISWMSVILDVNEPTNALSFDCEFMTSSEEQGILEIYWENELIGSIDERYAFAGTQNYIYSMPKVYQSGQYKLAIKLATFNDTISSVSIDNFRLKFYTPNYNLYLDNKIDVKDLVILIEAWLNMRIPQDIAPEDGDGIVNLYDFAAFAKTWEDNQNGMQSLAELNHNWLATWHYNADLNRDGVINLLDFTVLAEHWLEGIE